MTKQTRQSTKGEPVMTVITTETKALNVSQTWFNFLTWNHYRPSPIDHVQGHQYHDSHTRNRQYFSRKWQPNQTFKQTSRATPKQKCTNNPSFHALSRIGTFCHTMQSCHFNYTMKISSGYSQIIKLPNITL